MDHIQKFLLELGTGFNPEFTGRENVYLNGEILGISRRDMQRVFPDRPIIEIADIEGEGYSSADLTRPPASGRCVPRTG